MRQSARVLNVTHPWSPRQRRHCGTRWSMAIRMFEVFTPEGPMIVGLTPSELKALGTTVFDHHEPGDLKKRVDTAGFVAGWRYAVKNSSRERLDVEPEDTVALDGERVLHIRHFNPNACAIANL